MSERLFKFLLSELATVRLICQGCGVVVEAPVAKLPELFPPQETPQCRYCRKALLGKVDGSRNAFCSLAAAIADFKSRSDTVQVEFVLPDPSEKPTA